MKRILVVEDDPAIRRLATDLLKDEGYEVCTAATGAEGLDVIEDLRPTLPDLTVLDLMMPVMDGPTFHARLPEDARRVPLLVLSGSRAALDTATRLGADILVKPFDLDDLVARVARAVGDRVAPVER